MEVTVDFGQRQARCEVSAENAVFVKTCADNQIKPGCGIVALGVQGVVGITRQILVRLWALILLLSQDNSNPAAHLKVVLKRWLSPAFAQ